MSLSTDISINGYPSFMTWESMWVGRQKLVRTNGMDGAKKIVFSKHSGADTLWTHRDCGSTLKAAQIPAGWDSSAASGKEIGALIPNQETVSSVVLLAKEKNQFFSNGYILTTVRTGLSVQSNIANT